MQRDEHGSGLVTADEAAVVSELLAAMPDPDAVDGHWRRICQEMAGEADAAAYERGLTEGYLLAIADFKAFQQQFVQDAQLERRRWHLCCRRCRLEGHRDGCRNCEDRTLEAFGHAHPGELAPAEMAARTRASWEPYGLPPPGMVHLAGPVVHHHTCRQVCYAYKPGWYTPEAAAAILATLPGQYAEVLAELRALSGATAPGKVAA
jgi:hypothetical protein